MTPPVLFFYFLGFFFPLFLLKHHWSFDGNSIESIDFFGQYVCFNNMLKPMNVVRLCLFVSLICFIIIFSIQHRSLSLLGYLFWSTMWFFDTIMVFPSFPFWVIVVCRNTHSFQRICILSHYWIYAISIFGGVCRVFYL